MATPLIAHPLSPDLAVVAGTCGLVLIGYEFNRPGRVLPAASGALLLLGAAACWMARGVRPWAVWATSLSLVLCLVNAWRPTPALVWVGATGLLIAGLRFLSVSGAPEQVHWTVAVACGALVGTAASALTHVASRARRAKALN